jgi:hypothetical protein
MFGSPQGLDSLDPSVVRKKRKEVKKLILNLAGKESNRDESSWPKKKKFDCKCFWSQMKKAEMEWKEYIDKTNNNFVYALSDLSTYTNNKQNRAWSGVGLN